MLYNIYNITIVILQVDENEHIISEERESRN